MLILKGLKEKSPAFIYYFFILILYCSFLSQYETWNMKKIKIKDEVKAKVESGYSIPLSQP